MNFKELKLDKDLLDNLKAIGFEKPSEIQAAAIPEILKGKDILAQAQTGTGKTGAFLLPQITQTKKGGGIQHIILAPSRELAKQIKDEFDRFTKGMDLRAANIIGGVSYDIQRIAISNKPEILIATPGRLIDHLESKRINLDFSKVKTFTLDEADEMLNFGFYKEILRISSYIKNKTQTILFSATTNKRTEKLVKDILKSPVKIEISSGITANDNVIQEYVVLKEKMKLVALYNLLLLNDHKSVIIFGRTRKRVDELSDGLIKLGLKAKGIQGDMKQSERSRAMALFRDRKINILVGTDVLARGIDVDSVDLVFNFDLPEEIEYYTHRIGRTARAGRKGRSISFVKTSEEVYFQKIKNKTSSEIKKIDVPTDKDMEDIRAAKLDKTLSELLHTGREKYRAIGARITEEYTPEHLGLIVAAASIGNSVNPYDVSLTGQSGVNGKGKKRGSSRKGTSKGSSHRTSGGKSYSSRGRSSRGNSKNRSRK